MRAARVKALLTPLRVDQMLRIHAGEQMNLLKELLDSKRKSPLIIETPVWLLAIALFSLSLIPAAWRTIGSALRRVTPVPW